MTFVHSDLSGLASFQKIEWSYFENTCAVIPSDNMVHFYDINGNEIYKGSIRKTGRVSAIAWSPLSNTLAIGWSDGCISLWNNGQCTESQNVLNGTITCLSWHPSASLLFSAADNGNICCWDCSNMILPLFRGNSQDAIFTRAEFIPREAPFIFASTEDGILYSIENVAQPINEVCSLSRQIHSLTVSVASRRLIIIHGDNVLTQYNFPPSISQNAEIKLPVGSPPCCCYIRSDVFCYSINDSVYVWNIQNDETHILRAPSGQKITSLFFDSLNGQLCSTTAEGSIISWQCTMKGLVSRIGWTPPIVSDCGVRIENAYWSPSCLSFVASCSGRRPLIYRSIPLHAVVSNEVSVWQPTTDQIMAVGQQPVKISSSVERASTSGAYVLVATQSQVEIFTIRSGGLIPFSHFSVDSTLVDILGEAVFDCKGSSLECRNLQGTVKQTTNLGDSIAQFMSINGKFLTVICTDNNVFLYDISRRNPKLQFTTVFSTGYETPHRINCVSLSCGGFAISISIDIYEDGQWKPSPDLFLHSPQFDKTVSLQFEGRVPIAHYWDKEDPRLLCVQAMPYGMNYESTMSGSLVVPLFVADSLETYRQTTLQIDTGNVICALNIPRVYYQPPKEGITEPPQSATLPQFEGLDSADEASKKALMELNFHLATGDIDAAFNAIRGIDNKATWRSLATTCAQMRRIDLADLCFGRMEDGGSALLLHHAKDTDPDETAAIAVVDTQLGLYNEAKSVMKDNRRFDLLANLHQSMGEWQDTMTIANSSDRIHLRVHAHQNARSLEICGQLDEAIQKYELAGTIATELPRLALQANELKLLFNYINDRTIAEIPPKLLLWVGRFYEAHKQIDNALEYFEAARAYREIVRLNCCIGRWDDAAAVVKKSNTRSVICFYARMLIKRIDYYSKPENAIPQVDVDKLKHEVIELFRKARQFAQAMDFALQYEMIDDILALSFSAPPSLVCKAARWFEEQKEAKNAILLYSRAGRMNRALGLCFTMKQYDALDEISDTLNSKTDPGILIRCGQYFVESERWSKAAQCFALARQFNEVIELCNKHNIKLQNSVIQELSESKADPEVMKRFAALCEQQGAFQTAATLYIKFKDHLSAMKALARTGDTDKVVKFANLIKKRETYILAANFIMTQKPREGDKLFDTVVQLYLKAKAPDKLGRFFEATAQTEIDEYQEYEKGLDLIQKGLKLIMNAPDVKQKDQIVALMQMKIQLIEQYLAASKIVASEPKKAMQMCVELLKNRFLENVMRSDDVYIVMVQACVAQGNFKNAHQILEDLRNNGSDLTWFMDVESIKKIYAAVGQTFDPGETGGDGDYDEVDDDAIDDIDADDVDDIEDDD
ncbi:hypothetical protein TRFO_38925 [Tritrichomonas foetus]|uniref:Uncharacterized protein n=1 Tax=Tritrichomonas foetus TaxID=1144522 RepID=A0A1J4J6R7_9EUKA|nr:hypothetical protein TRFO_38925 [Tritrichomonas foetus]|eukprot:OHS94926.1 hypothetical protein TRFO_38925 [Tritrichomonas foetus]